MCASLAVIVAAPATIALGSDTAEPPITAAGAEGEYLRAAHKRIHQRWSDNFLVLATRELPSTSPINQPSRIAVVELAIARDGRIVSAQVVASSGHGEFDAAAVEVLRDSAPFPSPPAALVSDDGNLHLRWSLARDGRRCSGASIVRQEDPLEAALPRLLRDDRLPEALRRVNEARAAGGIEPAVSVFAKAWLAESLRGPQPSMRAAVILAESGQALGVKALENALNRPELATQAGAALLSRKIAVCPLVKDALAGSEGPRHAAALALRDAGDEACADRLVALLANLQASPAARAAAAEALGSIKSEAARKAVAGASKDPAPTVRAGAILAGARADAGRPAVLRLAPLIRDPAPEVRAAAAAGIVRAGGDTGLSELFLIFKESDPRPAEAVSREMAGMSSEATAHFLTRLLKRPQPRVRIAAAAALAARRDPVAQAALKPLLADPRTEPDLRVHAMAAADPADLSRLAATATTPSLALAAYRAMLFANQRDKAADWLLAAFPTLPPTSRAEALADWLTLKR